VGGWGATVNTSSRDAPRLERRAASEVRGKAVARARVWKWTVTRARVYGSGSRRGATRGLCLGIARVASAHLVRPGAPMKLQVLRDERRELRLHRLILHDPIQRHIRVRLHAGHGVGCARVAARLGGRRCPRAPEVCSRARGRFQSRGATENSLENTRVYNLFRPGTRDGRCNLFRPGTRDGRC